MRIAVGNDHAGHPLKRVLVRLLEERGHQVDDLGSDGGESVDYPDYARAVAAKVAAGEAQRGLLICGTGVGMSMAANRLRGVRAAVVSDPFVATMTRAHNDCNVLCLGQRVVGEGLARAIVDAWLETAFEGGRHQRRVDKIEPAP
jgi:ribose 5-phosphate isomerase B